jgi:hypothetical protein
VRNRIFKRHDKAFVLVQGDAGSAEFARYGILVRVAAYCGTEIPTFRWNLQSSSNLVEIYQPLEARSVSCIRYREYEGGTVHSSEENLS